MNLQDRIDNDNRRIDTAKLIARSTDQNLDARNFYQQDIASHILMARIKALSTLNQ
ncbi:hypothetical protein HOL63_02655 [Candidatus Peregrinibacteria bacterium]|jgi:hypothetical protein|nr:hypothetical protein [Candidatus Peregrinibacteria bacterium]MBT5468317.1 hypothetical protein [Candidatus Peregrinibacteria bacterium]MBT6823661.1 hypothetical protein [Candidatus Peribacter sp.]MBT7337676.1 hypothetical protein [Candidatus Peregrinibacteria bacterium]MBT7494763.1 hypothetical protein [Candidatus Peribacter sp.]